MLPHGAKHLGGIAVPTIRVGAGGHRPRRTSQLAPIRSAEHARGTARLRGGRRAGLDAMQTLKVICRLSIRFIFCNDSEAPAREAPSTTLRVVPLPRFAGADKAPPFSRRDFSPERSDQPFQNPCPRRMRGFFLLPFATSAKGSGTPTDAVYQPPHRPVRRAPCLLSLPHLRGRLSRGHARLSASHRGSRQRDLRHPRRDSGHASWDAV